MQEIRSLHPSASHYCYAWRISQGIERANDDGEPRGSAGLPILKRLVSKQCLQTMVVVVRYFGGSKLGVGGLIRAYGQAATAVLDTGEFEAYQEWFSLSFVYRYQDTGCVEMVLSQFEHQIIQQEYLERVFLQVSVLKDQKDGFCSILKEQSAGRIVPTNN